MAATLKLVYEAAKVRLGILIMACAFAGIAVSPGEGLSAWQLLVIGVATLVASSASGAFNQFYERDLDAKMKRTSSRPFVTGRFGVVGAFFPQLQSASLSTTGGRCEISNRTVATLFSCAFDRMLVGAGVWVTVDAVVPDGATSVSYDVFIDGAADDIDKTNNRVTGEVSVVPPASSPIPTPTPTPTLPTGTPTPIPTPS